MPLRKEYIRILEKYSRAENLHESLWNEVIEHYSEPSRRYHTLHHLDYMYTQLGMVKDLTEDWDLVVLALVYHDIIYDARSKSNEEDSAKVCAERMKDLGFSEEGISVCKRLIIATKRHELSIHKDDNFLVDADLAILGAERNDYLDYAKGVGFAPQSPPFCCGTRWAS